MSFLHTSVPLPAVLLLVGSYVLYRELIKLGFKRLIKMIRRRGVRTTAAVVYSDIPQQD